MENIIDDTVSMFGRDKFTPDLFWYMNQKCTVFFFKEKASLIWNYVSSTLESQIL